MTEDLQIGHSVEQTDPRQRRKSSAPWDGTDKSKGGGDDESFVMPVADDDDDDDAELELEEAGGTAPFNIADNTEEGKDEGKQIAQFKVTDNPTVATAKSSRKPRKDKGTKRGPRNHSKLKEAANTDNKGALINESSGQKGRVKSQDTNNTTKDHAEKEHSAINLDKGNTGTTSKAPTKTRKQRKDKGTKRGQHKPKNGETSKTSTTTKVRPANYAGARCGGCLGCRVIQNCGKCSPCIDMPEFGGPGTTGKLCILRKCVNRGKNRRKGSAAVAAAAPNGENSTVTAVDKKETTAVDQPSALQNESTSFCGLVGIQGSRDTSSDLESLHDYEDSVAGDMSDMEEMDTLMADAPNTIQAALKASRSKQTLAVAPSVVVIEPKAKTTVAMNLSAPGNMQEVVATATITKVMTLLHNQQIEATGLSAADLARQMQENQRAEMFELHAEDDTDDDSSDSDGGNNFFLPPPPTASVGY